ncbi:MAG: metallophosphoesterase family protein [Ruegeria sp.]
MIVSWLKSLVSRPDGAEPSGALATLAPGQRFYAVGDIHGRLDLLQQILGRLQPDLPIVFVGDYVDRGDHSAQVLRHLQHLSQARNRQVICLLGNHEDLLLRFLQRPRRTCRLWMHNGGRQTLASFGLTDLPLELTPDEAVRAARRLEQEMGPSLLEWMHARPLYWTTGNVTVVHAALDPGSDPADQTRGTCLWGHGDFPGKPRSDGQWVVHGHTIVPEPCVRNRVISIDTGAFATGRLTAAEIGPGTVRFLSADPVQA